MKKFFSQRVMTKFILWFLFTRSVIVLSQVGIGTTDIHESTILEIQSQNKGFLPPRISNTSLINTPAEGLLVYDESDSCLNLYNGSIWINLCDLESNNGGAPSNSLVDIDNNTYQIITIGTQTWMAENLKVTKYANGTNIPNVQSNTNWANLGDNNTDRGYCAQNNNASGEFNTYGVLYTYAAATNGDNSGSNVQGVCPTGWHLPNDGEWKTLEMQLGMSQAEADDELSSRGTDQGSQISSNPTLWYDGDLENNSNFGNSNFNAIPGGARYDYDGSFVNIGIHSYMWTSTENINNNSEAYARRIDFNNAGIFRAAHTKSYGIAVRCIKD